MDTKLLSKLNKCVTYNDILLLSEDLYSSGILIQRTNSNKIILCVVNEKGRVSCNKIFEDFVPLTSCGNEGGMLPNKILLNIIEFVNNIKDAVKINNQIINVNAMYGTSLSRLSINNEAEKSMVEELKNALLIDDVDAISRSCNGEYDEI